MLCTVPSFQCQVCGASFDVPRAALDRFPGWRPKYCRDHSPKKAAASPKKAAASPEKAAASPERSAASPGKASATRPRRGGASRARPLREQNLTGDQVRAKYTDGPASGVFTDGSAVPNPGPGGWGVVWVEDGQIVSEKHGHDPDTTNNRMELRALIEAFTMLPEDAAVSVYSDSRLCVNTITAWAPGWERRGWKKKSGPIMNLELVQELLALYRAHPACELQWIANSGYSGPRKNGNPAMTGIDRSEPGLFIPPLVMDPIDSRRLYFGVRSLYRTDNSAGQWHRIYRASENSVVSAVLRIVRRGRVRSVASLFGGQAEVIESTVEDASRMAGRRIQELSLPEE